MTQRLAYTEDRTHPPEAAQATRKKLQRQAPRKQKKLHPNSLVAAEFLILATSLPADGYPAEEVLAAYRLRWQIELAFKRLKSLLHIDRLPTRTPEASRSWLYTHLILALLCDDISQDLLESSPQDLLDAEYLPSLWTLQDTAFTWLVSMVLGPLSLDQLRHADRTVHRRLARTPRKRKTQLCYPLRR